MTQMHLVEATGLTPVHLNRMLAELRKHGVEFRRETIYISDWNGLVVLGDIDPRYLQAAAGQERRIRIFEAVQDLTPARDNRTSASSSA